MKFDGSKGTKDLRIKDRSQKGLYYRFGEDLNDAKLITGSLKRAGAEDSLEDFYSGDMEEGSV